MAAAMYSCTLAHATKASSLTAAAEEVSSYALQALRAQALASVIIRTSTLQWAVAPSAPVAAALHPGDGIAVILVTVAKTSPNRLSAI